MRYARRALVAGGLGFVVSFIVACGGSGGLLSHDQASTLNGQLDQVSSALASGDCGAVTNATSGLTAAVANLPDSVSATLRANLAQGASTVQSLAGSHCQPTSTTTISTTTTPPTTSTHTVSTATTPTVATPASTIPTPATTPAGSGTTSTGSSGGAGLGGGSAGGTGGAGAGNGNQ